MKDYKLNRLQLWQTLTVVLLVTGYAGYYLCRSNLAVALPLLIQELSHHGMSADAAKLQLGRIASLGVLAYAIGKFPSGWLADFLGGRRNYLFGMGGAVLFTFLLTVGGMPTFTLAWMCNRLVQSLGWAGIVKITSKWFSYSNYGTVMGIISLSFLFGDAVAREFMAILLANGISWRGLFVVAGGVLGVLLIFNTSLLRECPNVLGLPEPLTSPDNLFREEGERHTPASLSQLLSTFLSSRTFLLACVLSLGLTVLREAFNLWIPTYCNQSVGLNLANSAQVSALFSLAGGLSVLLAGFVSDRIGSRGRITVMFYGLILLTLLLVGLALAGTHVEPVAAISLITAAGFALNGPYSYLAGAMSLDFGGKQGSATASGLIDGIGYFGGVLAGSSVASISIRFGWGGAFGSLALVALLSSIAAAVSAFTWKQKEKSVEAHI